VLSGAHAAELRRALEALERVVAARLEERRSYAVHDPDPRRAAEALLQRPLGYDGGEGLPAPDAFAGTGPLARIVDACGLSVAEALVVTAAVAPEVDAKFAVYYRLLADRPADGLTREAVTALVARTFGGRLAAAALLPGLVAARLLDVDGERVTPAPDLVAAVTGAPPPGEAAGFPAKRLSTVHTLDDVVVPADVRRALLGIVDRVTHGPRVLDEWGFAERHDDVRGTLVLFHGPPGTGKSMTAAVLARTAGLVAYQVDLSALVSKWIGETEKNLARVFDRAAAEGWLLVFDEADAVFGKRTEVSDARDRYANQEVSYLLQRIEAHPGVVVLTTNLLANIDDAFARRVDLRVEFPVPTRADRERLWSTVWPTALPVDASLDLAAFADRYAMTGAEIRDAALDAAYAAAADGGVVTAEHVEEGVRGVYARGSRSLPGA